MFWTLENFLFSGQKKFLFSLQSQKALLLVLFRTNLNKEKKWYFLAKKYGLTPLKKCDFLYFEKFFFIEKTASFSLQSN